MTSRERSLKKRQRILNLKPTQFEPQRLCLLKQASISQVREGKLSRENGYLSIDMCYYPRGLRKVLIDEYRSDLAPDRELFKEWKSFERAYGHEEAFRRSHYEERFKLSPAAKEHLRELGEM